jgi:N-acetyl-alpha-D-muramate 1-phosphate uridylyltransferase
MKAMILAAGRGERMRPLTDHTPKPLLKVGGKALIVWHIERLARAGFNDIVINHAYLGEQIEKSLGNGKTWGVSIEYSAELIVLETAGGIANAKALLGNAPFLVVNGDVYTDYEFGHLTKVMHAMQYDEFNQTEFNQTASSDIKSSRKVLAHLVMVDNPPQHALGDFSLHAVNPGNNFLVREDGAPKLTFSGIGVYQTQLFDNIAHGTAAKLAPILRAAMMCGQVTGEHFKGAWFDIGTPERLQQLDAILMPSRVST